LNRRFAPALVLLTSFACAHAPSGVVAHLPGSVTYRERIALAPGSTLEVKLLDTSREGEQGIVVAAQTIENPGQVPIAFDLAYDTERIDPKHRYQIDAHLVHGGTRLFEGAADVSGLMRGTPQRVALELRKASSEPVDASEEPLGSR